MHDVVCLGLSHRTAPVELRERIGALGPGAERCPGIEEHASLATCYRVELYARLSTGVDDARDELITALSALHGVERELLVEHLYVHSGDDAARHLCRVAAGLDSLVLGEAEILGQVGDAFEAARAAGTVGPGLSLLFRAAITSGRRARSETAISKSPATASTMALSLAEGVLGDLRERQVLVIGAGRIGFQTLKALQTRDVRAIAVANRTFARANEVATRFGVAAHTLDDVSALLRRADVVVTATASEEPVVSADVVRVAMMDRSTRPLVVVDLAVPADVERATGDVTGVSLFDVDDLRAGLDGTMSARLREVPRVEDVVEEEVETFRRRYAELEVEPILAALRRQAEDIREREVERALRDLGEVEPRTAERIEHLSRALVNKLLHEPTARARQRAGAGDADEVGEAVRELFGLAVPREP